MGRADLNTSAWKRTRRTVLERDGGECQIGGRGCRYEATEVDHIVPVNLGGDSSLGNLRAACRPCNAALGHLARGNGTPAVFEAPPPPMPPPTFLSLARPLRGPTTSRTHREVPE